MRVVRHGRKQTQTLITTIICIITRFCPTARLCPISRGYARPRGVARSREALPAISYRCCCCCCCCCCWCCWCCLLLNELFLIIIVGNPRTCLSHCCVGTFGATPPISHVFLIFSPNRRRLCPALGGYCPTSSHELGT